MDGLSQEIGSITGLLASVREGFLTLKVPVEARLMLVAQLDSIPPMLARLETYYREGALVARKEQHRRRVEDLQRQLQEAREAGEELRQMCEAATPLFRHLAETYVPPESEPNDW